MAHNILLVCERSAGHIFPALAVGQALRKTKSHSGSAGIFIFATAGSLKHYISDEGFTAVGRSFSFRNLLLESFWRLFEAMYLLARYRPKLVIGFGGRDSFFLVLFASFLGIRTALYEPNVTMGKANKMLCFFVKELWRGFTPLDSDKKTRVIGIPLRKNIIKIDSRQARQQLGLLEERPVIFCFGGSQGSVFLNQIFTRFVAESRRQFDVIHLTGKYDYHRIQEFYTTIKRNAFIRDFYYNIEILYSAADIIISRAGALTLGEISFYKRAPVLIPHPQAGSHQKENARYFVRAQAARMFEQNDFSFESFRDSLHELLDNAGVRQGLCANMSRIQGGVAFEDFCKNFNC